MLAFYIDCGGSTETAVHKAGAKHATDGLAIASLKLKLLILKEPNGDII